MLALVAPPAKIFVGARNAMRGGMVGGLAVQTARVQQLYPASSGLLQWKMATGTGDCGSAQRRKKLENWAAGEKLFSGVLEARAKYRRDSLVRDVLVLNATVDEAGKGVGRLLDSRSLLGDGELLEQLVKDLDGLSVLGRHLGQMYVVFRLKYEEEGIERAERTNKRLSKKAHRDDGGVDSALSWPFFVDKLRRAGGLLLWK